MCSGRSVKFLWNYGRKLLRAAKTPIRDTAAVAAHSVPAGGLIAATAALEETVDEQ
jgi:hypothetical protein